jgi:anthranilate synthase component I
MIQPNFAQFEQQYRAGNIVPLFMKIPGDLDTPLSAFLKIDNSVNSFLLESVEGGERWGRFSFLGSNPRMTIAFKDGVAMIREGASAKTISDVPDPTRLLKEIMARFRAASVPGLPDFFGGAVGFFAYDVVRAFERIPNLGKPDPAFHDAWFMVSRDMVIFDNFTHRIYLVTTVSPEEAASAQAAYNEGCHRLESLKEQLSAPIPNSKPAFPVADIPFSSNMPPEQFEEMVRRAKQHITAGDIIQVVLSQRFCTDGVRDPLNAYRAMRLINPSPYMFFLRMGDESVAGASPEVMVRLKDGEAVVRPIAGTRPRSSSPDRDAEMERDLLDDPKESAEHVMLVDLARNDLGRIAVPGTVTVDAFKTVEKYSHVMHMVSNVRAGIAKGYDAFDVLRSTFPAGTLSGAPKIRAMEIIEDLEPEHRGPYGGCVGYFSFTGCMDMGITIRTVTMKGERAYFQAGAGIVADSVPEKEYRETMSKAQAMREALVMAQEFGEKLK